MINDLLVNVFNQKSASDWEVYGFSLGDDFDSVINEVSSYDGNRGLKVYKQVKFYKSKDSNKIGGIFFSIPLFQDRYIEFLKAIKENYGEPYFEHLKMNNRLLYYCSEGFIVSIPNDEIEKGICLSLGECGHRLQSFKAVDLLDAYFKMSNLDSYVFREDNKEIKTHLEEVKLDALKALLLAFVGDNDIKKFKYGKFILDGNSEVTNKRISELGNVEIFLSLKHSTTSIISEPSKFELYQFWSNLFKYYFNSITYIRNSRMFNFTNWQRQDLEDFKIVIPRHLVIQRIDELKKMLGRFIDPDQREYDIKVMIEDYGYPSEDIYWMEVNDY